MFSHVQLCSKLFKNVHLAGAQRNAQNEPNGPAFVGKVGTQTWFWPVLAIGDVDRGFLRARGARTMSLEPNRVPRAPTASNDRLRKTNP